MPARQVTRPSRPLVHARRAAAHLGCLAALLLATAAEAADPRLKEYRWPEGWDVRIAAAEPLVVNPVTMTFGNDGRLYVVEWMPGRGPNDRIRVLIDTDGDGTFDRADPYMDGLELPAGILFWDGWTYLTLNHEVVRLKDRDGDGSFETREAIVGGFGNDDSHHRVSGLTLGPDGCLYITTGDSDAHAVGSDGSTATVLRSGGVFRCRPDGSHLEVVAFGMRNPWGNVAFDDAFRIFHTDNDNEGTPGFTGCRLLHVVEGGDYGWRLREGARCCAPDFDRATWNGGRPGRLGWLAETGRGAPAGLCVLNSEAFPPSTRNLLVYPDVFRKLVRAYKLKPNGATFEVAAEFPLLASDDPLFRPDDAEVGTDGALYILDWRTDSGGAGQLQGNGTSGRLYRMTWSGTEREPARKTLPPGHLANLARDTDKELMASFNSEDFGTRLAAGREIARRGHAPERVRLLADVVRSESSTPAAKRHALATLAGLGRPDEPKTREAASRHSLQNLLLVALAPADPDLHRVALELIGRDADPDHATLATTIVRIADGPPEVTRAAAVALGRFRALRSARPGEEVDLARIGRQICDSLGLSHGLDGTRDPALLSRVRRRMNEAITVDSIARYLLDLGVRQRRADPFLRDGITRGLERLGPTAVEELAGALRSGEPERREAALYVLEGWRNDDALATVLAAATTKAEIPAQDRLNLFRTLREEIGRVPPDRIAGWLANAPDADPAARAEAVRLLSAMHRRAQLAAGPLLPALLADRSPEVRRAALGLAGEVRSERAKAGLVAIVTDARLPADERRMALAAVRGYEDRSLAPVLDAQFAGSKDGGFRGELLRTLASLDFDTAARRAESLLDDPDRETRQEAISLLGQRPATALVVARRYNEGKLPAEDLARVVEAVRPHATPELQAALQTLLKNKLLGAPTGAEARKLREEVGRHGNAERGRAIYLDAKKGGCAVCHRMEGLGGAVGPDLTRVWETLSFDKRVESILDPSKEIKEGYATFKVATKDGRTVTGLLLSDTAEAVVLKDAQGREVRIPGQEVEEKGTDRVSLMPAGVVGHLSFNELADLLAFLGDRRAQEALRSQKP